MSGNTVFRALRGYLLTESAQITKLLLKFIPEDVLQSLEDLLQVEHGESESDADGDVDKEEVDQEED